MKPRTVKEKADQLALIMKLHNDGLKHKDIGKIINRSKDTVGRIIRRQYYKIDGSNRVNVKKGLNNIGLSVRAINCLLQSKIEINHASLKKVFFDEKTDFKNMYGLGKATILEIKNWIIDNDFNA
jgi:orotate phosphoribosyltransferase-like protein